MNTDEKNKFASTSNQFDPDMRKDKYDEFKHDKEFQHSDKRKKQYTTDITDQTGQTQHDPYNEKLQHHRSSGIDFNREESPSDKDLYHGDLIEHKRHIYHKPRDYTTLTTDDPKVRLHDLEKVKQHKVERVHEKRDQFPEIHNPNDRMHMRHAPHK
jgi:hypothetical protein